MQKNIEPQGKSNERIKVKVNVRGVATGGISVFIPPKSAQLNILWGKNDVRTDIQQFYTPQKTFIPRKQISGYAPGKCIVAYTGWAKKSEPQMYYITS